MAYQGLLLGGITLAVYGGLLAMGSPPGRARTAAFATLAFAQLVHVFNVRAARRSAAAGLLSNRWLVGALLVSAALVALVLTWRPLGAVFDVVALKPHEWAMVALGALAPLPVVEAVKAVERVAVRFRRFSV